MSRKQWKYLKDKIETTESDDKVMDTIFPISFFKVARAPERKPIKDPDDISD